MGAHRTIPATCQECGHPYPARLDRVRAGTTHFCSRACRSRHGMRERHQQQDWAGERNPNWRGGRSRQPYRYTAGYRARHPEAVKAHFTVMAAIRTGRLQPQPCQECGATKRPHAHHEDYSRPLEVTWLCERHHRMLHGKAC